MEDPYRLMDSPYYIQKEMTWWVLYERKPWGDSQMYMSQELDQARAALYRILCGDDPNL
jgi:hypothetical protein